MIIDVYYLRPRWEIGFLLQIFMSKNTPWGSGLEKILHIPSCVVRGDWMGRSFGWDRKNWGPESQHVWHDKDPSLLKGPERRALAMVTSPYKWTSSWAGRKTVNNQSIMSKNQEFSPFDRRAITIISSPVMIDPPSHNMNLHLQTLVFLPSEWKFTIHDTSYSKNKQISADNILQYNHVTNLISGGSRNFEKGEGVLQKGGTPEIAKNSRILGVKSWVLLTF
jgi:hypothetical protein